MGLVLVSRRRTPASACMAGTGGGTKWQRGYLLMYGVLRYLSRDAISWRPAVGKSELLKQPSTSTPSPLPILPPQLISENDHHRCPAYFVKHLQLAFNDLKLSWRHRSSPELQFTRLLNPTKGSIKQGPSFVCGRTKPDPTRPYPKPVQAVYFWT